MKNRMKFILLLITLISLNSHASFRSELIETTAVKQMIAEGFTHIADQNLSEIQRDLLTVRFKTIDGVPIGSCGRRIGMLNWPDKNLVVVPKAYFKSALPQDVLSAWVLHEGYSATNRFDENYGFSVGLTWLASKTQMEKFFILSEGLMEQAMDPRQEIAACSGRFPSYLVAGGGSTGVGGGGDPFAVQIKLELMNSIYDDFSLGGSAKNFELIKPILIRALRLPLEAMDVDFTIAKDATRLLQLVEKISKDPVEFVRSDSGQLIVKYPVMDLNEQPALRQKIVMKIQQQLYIEELQDLNKKMKKSGGQ